MIVRDILEEAKEVLGFSDLPKIFKRIDRAIEVLGDIGNWYPLIGYVDILTLSDKQTVTLPRYIETPINVNICGKPAYFRSRWHEFHLNGAGSFGQVPWTWDDVGEWPVAMDIVDPSVLIAVAEQKTDLGAVLRIIGFDERGNFIRTQLPDGTWEDGFRVPINIINDYMSGVITPDNERRFVRNMSTVPMTELLSSSAHQMVTGEPVVLSLVAAPLPTPLVVGNTYYARRLSSTALSLHASLSAALSGQGAIQITSALPTSQIKLKDERAIRVLTQFLTPTANRIITQMPVSFSGTTLPSPLVAATNYFARKIDSTHFTIHETAADAENNVNPIDVTTPGTAVVASGKQSLAPSTHLTSAIPHGLANGDSVQMQNASGTLPEPLLPSVTYYAHYLTSTKFSLHTSLADATAGTSPITMTTLGSGQTTVVKTIDASASVGSSNQIAAINHNLQSGDYVQFATTGSLPIPLSQNTNYLVAIPKSSSSFTVVDLAGNAINLTSTGNGQLQVVVSRTVTVGFDNKWITDASQLVTGDAVQVDAVNALPATTPSLNTLTDYYVQKLLDDTIKLFTTQAEALDLVARSTATRSRASNVATLTTGSPHGFSNGDYVEVRGVGGTLWGALRTLTITKAGSLWTTGDDIVITNIATGKTATGTIVDGIGVLNINNNGSGFVTGDTIEISNGTNTASARITADGSGNVTAITITRSDTGFSIGDKNYAGGTLTYTTSGIGIGLEFDVTALGVGSVVFSDPGSGFSVGDLNSGSAPTLSYSTTGGGANLEFRVATISDWSSYNSERVQITVTGPSSFTYASAGFDEPSNVDTDGVIVRAAIKVNGPGVGNVYLAFVSSVTAIPFTSLLAASSPQYIEDGTVVRFATNGSLPAPLAILTDYKARVEDGLLRVSTMGGVDIVLTSIGSGAHTFYIERTFGVTIPTSVSIVSNSYNDGDAVLFQTTGVAPTGLVNGSTYYLRRISDDTVEVYDTAAHAKNLLSTVGRIVPTDTGSGTHTMTQTLPNFRVSKVDRVIKSASKGFIALYAWDNGRDTELTQLGNYYPDEIEPQYRRIKIAECSTWVRMRYQKRQVPIQSDSDFIPLHSGMALIAMLKSLEYLRMDQIDKAEAYQKKAEKLLWDAQECRSGAEVMPIQVNDGVTTNSQDSNEYM